MALLGGSPRGKSYLKRHVASVTCWLICFFLILMRAGRGGIVLPVHILQRVQVSVSVSRKTRHLVAIIRDYEIVLVYCLVFT